MLLRARANTGFEQVKDGSSVRHETFHMLEEAQAEAHRWKTESEHKDLLIRKLVSTHPTGHLWQLCVPVSVTVGHTAAMS